MRSRRYVAWLGRHSFGVLAVSGLLVAISVYLAAFHLPLQSDFAALLPADAPSVKAAEQLARRAPARDTMLMIVKAPDPASRAAAAQVALDGVAAIDRRLVEYVESENDELRDFVRQNQGLYAPASELDAVREALAAKIDEAKLAANPLFIELDDPKPAESTSKLDELREKQREAFSKLDKQKYVNADKTMQVLVIKTSFVATDVNKDRALMTALGGIRDRIASVQPAVTVGFAGGPAVTIAEHRALSRGIVLSTIITALLVSLVLWLHMRSVRLLFLLAGNIVVGTLVSFGAAAISVGHLNAATAFLGAIIAGNGVNYGILLVARYLEERKSNAVEPAMASAITGTLAPTLVASLGAAIAYGALGATAFRGFADFALIGGIGMLVCWVASFTLLPVMVMRFGRGLVREPAPLFGRIVVRVFGFRRPALVCAVAGGVTLLACGISWRYLANDPYEYDLTQLRSRADDAQEVRHWLAVSDENFGRGLAGLAGQTYVAVDDAAKLPAVIAQLKEIAAKEPIVGNISSVLDVIPEDQAAKLAVLADIRSQIDEVADQLDESERLELLALRPADSLAAITPEHLPPALRKKLTERDGRVGLMVAVKPGTSFDERDGKDLISFAAALRGVEAEGVTVAGASLLFADVLLQIQKDGPLVTLIASIGLVVMVLLVVGRSRRALAVLVATSAGSILMIAVCAVAGIKINFLDFVALPITLGLGIDYAINVADRATKADPIIALRSTGGTVLVCSLTTVIGYLSLMVSDNLSIRGFGLASLIGEITCMIAAFVIVPAMIALPMLRRPSATLDAGRNVLVPGRSNEWIAVADRG
jgi:predicted RND superfamily exporter protein